MQLSSKEIDRIIETALAEDIGKGDITTNALIDSGTTAKFSFVSREDIILCGLPVITRIFDKFAITQSGNHKDGDKILAGETLLKITGEGRAILTVERVSLNLLQHMSGIATLTHKYVERVKHTKAKILDTRKTMPGLREIEKYAVGIGGGQNHRMRLDDGVLIKDNHITICGGVKEALKRARKNLPGIKIEIECESLEQVKAALENGADILLLDNMKPALLKEIVALVKGQIPLEASGGINLDNVKQIAETGVDFISIGALTHSAPNADIGLDMS